MAQIPDVNKVPKGPPLQHPSHIQYPEQGEPDQLDTVVVTLNATRKELKKHLRSKPGDAIGPLLRQVEGTLLPMAIRTIQELQTRDTELWEAIGELQEAMGEEGREEEEEEWWEGQPIAELKSLLTRALNICVRYAQEERGEKTQEEEIPPEEATGVVNGLQQLIANLEQLALVGSARDLPIVPENRPPEPEPIPEVVLLGNSKDRGETNGQ